MNKEDDSMTTESPVTESETTKEEIVDTRDKCLRWEEIHPKQNPNKLYDFGSRNLTKMIMFLKDVTLTKEEFQQYLDLLIARLESEPYEFYRIRRVFVQHLLKYRKEVRSFIMMNALQKFMDEQKAEKARKQEEELKNQNTVTIPEKPII